MNITQTPESDLARQINELISSDTSAPTATGEER